MTEPIFGTALQISGKGPIQKDSSQRSNRATMPQRECGAIQGVGRDSVTGARKTHKFSAARTLLVFMRGKNKGSREGAFNRLINL